MTTLEIIFTAIGSALGAGGGGAIAWKLIGAWLDGRRRLSERRSEVEIAGEEGEQRARLAILEENRRTVARVADTQERLAGAVELWASSYRVIADHAKSVNDRLDRIEDAMGIKRGSAVPVPASPPPRPITPSSPGIPVEAAQPQR